MSLPVEPDFALIKMGDGADPEVFTLICGIQDVTRNETVQKSDRYRRDCAKPGETPLRRNKVNGMALDVEGGGIASMSEVSRLKAALGKVKNYTIEYYLDDGTDAGELIGSDSGAFLLAGNNMSFPREGDATGGISLASDGEWTYTAA